MTDQLEYIMRSVWMPGDHIRPSDQFLEHYRHKMEVAKRFQPRNVVEIGTRCGYSLAAFSVGHKSSYLCFDAGVDHDSERCEEHWHTVVSDLMLDAKLIVVNSQSLIRIPKADLAHVDGDHGYKGAYHDLVLVKDSDVILADDCDIYDVKKAVHDFSKLYNKNVELKHDGLREYAILTNK
jgi:hypothetical protein